MGGELGGEWIRVCVAESLGSSPETITTLSGYTPVQNKQVKKAESMHKEDVVCVCVCVCGIEWNIIQP